MHPNVVVEAGPGIGEAERRPQQAARGGGEVDKVHGKVTIRPEYKIIEIPPESGSKPPIPTKIPGEIQTGVVTKKVSEDVNQILLERKRFIATMKAQGHEKTCPSLQEIADLIKSHATLEIKPP